MKNSQFIVHFSIKFSKNSFYPRGSAPPRPAGLINNRNPIRAGAVPAALTTVSLRPRGSAPTARPRARPPVPDRRRFDLLDPIHQQAGSIRPGFSDKAREVAEEKRAATLKGAPIIEKKEVIQPQRPAIRKPVLFNPLAKQVRQQAASSEFHTPDSIIKNLNQRYRKFFFKCVILILEKL